MAAGDVKIAYAASASLTVTNLHALPASQTWVAGWESDVIDNTTNKYLDYLVSGTFTEAASTQAGSMFIYVVAMISDTVWPGAFDGTESTESIPAAYRDLVCKLGASFSQAAAANDSVVPFGPFSVANLFGGVCPAKFVIYITGNLAATTGAQLAAAGSLVTIKGVYNTVAAS